ncbi:hypothetical protein NBRC116590_09310 [Pelagimonas sp. KU-00592-HH]|uniref:choice-of-anchor L domain-containing protein n=1 Tax=Pelagimonas sp. KU-00592-HH TaxID=3127651 RepID=UPI003106F4FC
MVQAAELNVNTSATALEMANAMFGAGVTVLSATFTGDGLASGIYTGGESTSPGAVPADTGVILSTGKATDFTNSSGTANQSEQTSTNNAGVDNDALLNGIAGVRTYDAAIFEADFIPTGDTLSMQLVFSSEEYLEWVNAGFNDAVGIWVNGTKAELAIGDGDISIDNINTTVNENLFINNGTSAVNTEMDGLTIVLTVKAPVNDGVTNTIRFGIADAGDAIYDSNLLIVGDSVQTALIAEDDTINVTAKGETLVDLLANDDMPSGSTVTISKINGQAVSAGQSITLDTGQQLTLTADGKVHVQATADLGSVVFTYTISNGLGQSDVAYATLVTDPVDGTSGDDSMILKYTDADGNQIEGTDGASEVIMGYGGHDKIFAGDGHDDIHGGSGNDFIRAGTGNDLILGGTGNDVLDGGTGDDTMAGGSGNDIYYIESTGDQVNETANNGHDRVITTHSHTLGTHFEDLWLREGSAATDGTGNAQNNLIVGNANNNTLTALGGNDRVLGEDGNDTILGDDGNDDMEGGAGNDSLSGGNGADKLRGGTGTDVIDGGTGNDLLRGGWGADTITGGDGDDNIDGGAGADIMSGGKGNDVYRIDTLSDTIIEAANQGTDTVFSTFDWTLGDNLEHLRLKGAATAGTGNALNNRIFGTGGDNALSGLDGADDLRGMGGQDILLGGAGNDILKGGLDNDFLSGGAGADRLKAGVGQDTLDGGTGNDRLFTGNGADHIVFRAGDGHDTIRDFDATDDTLVFHGLDASDLTLRTQGNGVVIVYGEGDSIYFSGSGALTLDQFTFDFV